MYICQKCGRVSNSGESANSIVTKTRPKIYNNGQISRGWEIVTEMNVCKTCFKEHKLCLV